jgi:hypothetical protein
MITGTRVGVPLVADCEIAAADARLLRYRKTPRATARPSASFRFLAPSLA